MEYIAYLFLTWLILIVAGLPVSLLVLPTSLKRYSLLFAPLIGFCIFAFVSYYLFRLNIGGTDVYAWPLFSISVVLLIALAVVRKGLRAELIAACNREVLGVLGLVAFGLMVVSVPFFVATSGHALAGSMSNLDIAELSVVSRFLQEFSPGATQGFLGQTGHLITTCRDVWFGPSIIVAIVSSLLHAAPYQLQMIVMSVMAVQAIAFVYLLARLTLDFTPFGGSVLAVLYTVCPVPLFTIWQSFGGQMFAISLMLALFVVQTVAFRASVAGRSRAVSYLIPSVILLSGIILSYHFMVPIAGLFLVLFGAWHVGLSRSWNRGIRSLLMMLAAFAACAALNPFRVKALVGSMGLLTGNNGWFIPWLSPDVIAGPNAALAFVTADPFVHRFIWIGFVTLALLPTTWYIVARPQAVSSRSFVLGLALPTALLGFAFAYMDAKGGHWGGYRSFKITASFSALLFLAAGIGFANCSWRHRRPIALLGAFFAAVTAWGSLQNTKALADFTEEHAFFPVPEIRLLQEVESMPFVHGINVMDADNFSLLWTNYFTLKVRQTYQRFPYGGRPVGVLNEEFSLAKDMSAARAAGHTDDIFSVEASPMKSVYSLGPWYLLYQAEENRDVTITPAEGWWPAEPTHRWSGSNGKVCSVYIDSHTAETKVFIAATFMNLADGRHVSATINGKPLKLEQDTSHLRSEGFILGQGRNILEFQTNFMPQPPTSWDPRTLAIGWMSVVVKFQPKGVPIQASAP